MKICFFRILTALLLFGSSTAEAQEMAPHPEKEIVVIDFFARNRTVPMPYMEAFRQQVLAAFADRGRHHILDAQTTPALALPGMGWDQAGSGSAAADRAAFLESRTEAMLESGARYVVTGAVSDYKFEHVDLYTGSKTPPRPGFRATFQVVLSGYDLKLGCAIADQIYVLKGEAPIAEEADQKAIATLRGQLEYFIDKNFKFETLILQLGPEDPRKGVRELYIHCGTDMGVKQGDLFLVYEEVPVGGVFTRELVGRLRVNNVQTGEVAKCKIAKGNTEITDAFRAGRGLICISDGKALFY